ncbi:hypothetical protein AWU68_0745 [Corynebacterium simulans]|nr:hypothetical protein AWU68_0745 [Corynebacterium simulans]
MRQVGKLCLPVQALDDGVVKQPIRRNRIPAVRPGDTR